MINFLLMIAFACLSGLPALALLAATTSRNRDDNDFFTIDENGDIVLLKPYIPPPWFNAAQFTDDDWLNRNAA